MARPKRETARKRAYRERLREMSRPNETAVEARIDEIRPLLRPDAAPDLVRDYARIGLALDAELARHPRRARAVQELANAKSRLAEQLQVTPQARRASGEEEQMISMRDVAKSLQSVLHVRRSRWELLKQEIQMLDRHEDLGGQNRELYVAEIAALREKNPGLFDASELAADPEELYDGLLATAPSRLPGEPFPAH